MNQTTLAHFRLIHNDEFRRLFASESIQDAEMARFAREMERGEIADADVFPRTIDFMRRGTLRFDTLVRRLCVQLRQLDDVDACPLLSSESIGGHESAVNKVGVIHIVLNSLPIPDETTPWEQIIEFTAEKWPTL